MRSFHSTPRAGHTARRPGGGTRTWRHKPTGASRPDRRSMAPCLLGCPRRLAHPGTRGIEGRRGLSDQRQEARDPADHREGVPAAAAALETPGDVQGPLLPESAHRGDGLRPPGEPGERRVRLDPAVLGLRPVRRDTGEHGQPRLSRRRLEGVGDRGPEVRLGRSSPVRGRGWVLSPPARITAQCSPPAALTGSPPPSVRGHDGLDTTRRGPDSGGPPGTIDLAMPPARRRRGSSPRGARPDGGGLA